MVFFTGGGVVCQTAAKKCEVKLERLTTSTVNGNSSSSNSNNSNNSTSSMSNNTDSSKFKRPLSSSSIKNDHDDDLRPPGKKYSYMVFYYQNFCDLLWEKIVHVIEKNFWKSRLKAENLQKFLRSLEQFIQTVKGQNNFW